MSDSTNLHNPVLESGVIGACLTSPDALSETIGAGVQSADFHTPAHRLIWDAITALNDAGGAVDMPLVFNRLVREGTADAAGGPDAILGHAQESVVTPDRIGEYVLELRTLSVQRKLLEFGADAQKAGSDTLDVAGEISRLTDELAALQAAADIQGHDITIGAAIGQVLDWAEEVETSGGALLGPSFTLPDLDKLTRGLRRTEITLIAARPAMGKCLPASTRVLDPATGSVRSIGDIVAAGGGMVASLDRTVGRIVASPVVGVADNGRRAVYRVTTASGRTVRATANHRVLTDRGFIEVGDLRVGADHLEVPLRLPMPQDPARMKSEEVRLLGYMLGDGSFSTVKTSPGFTAGLDEVLADVIACAEALGARTRVKRAWTEDNRSTEITFAAGRLPSRDDVCERAGVTIGVSKRHRRGEGTRGDAGQRIERAIAELRWSTDRRGPVQVLLDDHGLWPCHTHDKHIPDAIMRLPADQLTEFLGCLWATDGWIAYSQNTTRMDGIGAIDIGFASSSERLSRDVAHLLLRLGIAARIDYKPNGHAGAWQVAIHDADQALRFCDLITVPGKQDAVDRVRAIATARDGGRTGLLMYPATMWERIDTARKATGMSWPDLFRRAGLRTDKQGRDRTRRLTPSRLRAFAEVLDDDSLHRLLDGDTGFDPIVSVEPDGTEATYDIQVDPHHNFIADDLIVHNSLVAGQLALEAARGGYKTAFVSLEMSQLDLGKRFMSAEARMPTDKMEQGTMDDREWQMISKAAARLDVLPMMIIDDAMTFGEIAARIERAERELDGLDLIIVDYLQLVELGERVESRQQEVSTVSRRLKLLAKKKNCAVLALSQLSRKVEERQDRRPILSDLRECLTGDTKVWRADTGARVPIRDLVDGGPVKVWSVDDRGRLIRSVMTEVWSTGVKPVTEIQLASGRRVRATDNHPFLSFGGWAKTGDLVVGDLLAAVGTSTDPERPNDPDSSAAGVQNVPLGGDTGTTGYRRGAGVADTAASELFWDEIVAISPAGEEETFDAAVPGPNAFIANDIVSHNSGALEQDAAAVVFLYRDEVYNPDSPDVGIVEFGLAKNRHGPIGVVSASFIPQHSMFKPLERRLAPPDAGGAL
ncbi:Replicative DNA helicase (plasmid) [Euzebya pacifica]|uniref:DNA 5'-3' helicase n=1 Tax=Euzebya pacifica TaxID=1608957 RepID=A0A346Y793_9ACTN|nr:DnaB-like helicase C-terminal domain-containing protein [Euzebya pacifica]AXV10340.1 Replicative DNA helicase [Euzebya pacifica]